MLSSMLCELQLACCCQWNVPR